MKQWVHYPPVASGNYGWHISSPAPLPREKLTIPSYQLTTKFVHVVLCQPLQVIRRALGGQTLVVAVDQHDTRLALLGGSGTPQA